MTPEEQQAKSQAEEQRAQEQQLQQQGGYAEPHVPPPTPRGRQVELPEGVPTISAGAWNATVSAMRTGFLRVSQETSMGAGGNLPQGRIVDSATINPFMNHPFRVLPVWDSEIELHGDEISSTHRRKGCWKLYITPGFLNGHPPAIRMWNQDIPKGARVWANDYGKKSFGIGNHQSVLLTDQPMPFIKCTGMIDTRSKVYPPPGCPAPVKSGEVPLYLRARGAYRPEQLDFGDFLFNLLSNRDAEAVSQYLIRMINGATPAYVISDSRGKDDLPEGHRACLSADVVLQVDRPTVKQRFEPDDIGLLRYSGFDIELPTRDDYSARIFEVPIYIPPCPPTYWDIIFGTYIEYQYDEIPLARVYFLSPHENYREEGAPDGTWLPYVRHEVFWNLNYSSIQQIDQFTHDTSLEWFKSILSVLAGGVAWLFAVSVVNPIEAAYDQINTAMNQTAVKGQFWTG